MAKKLALIYGILTLAFLYGQSIGAQEPSTLVLKSGERVSGELIDMNASGIAMRVGGRDMAIRPGDVAMVEFVGGSPNAEAVDLVNKGQPVIVLRSGQIVVGRLTDIGGTHPLRLTVDTTNGSRDLSSADVAQIYMAPLPAAAKAEAAASPATRTPAGAVSISVAANAPWTDTGITVQRGQLVRFVASGDIMVAPDASSGVGGSPLKPAGPVPVPSAGVGALIARVGNSQAFLVATNTSPIPMPASGQLQLGINDDHHADNTGAFTVAVTTTPPATGRIRPR